MQNTRKVYIYDKNGELVKVVKDKKSAARFAHTSTSSVTRSITGNSTSSHCGYHFRYEGQELGDLRYRSAFGRKPVVCKDKKDNTIQIYRTQREAAVGQNISQSQICNQLRKRIDKDTFIKKYGVYFEYYDGEIEPLKTTKKQQEYFINILVGLVNGTSNCFTYQDTRELKDLVARFYKKQGLRGITIVDYDTQMVYFVDDDADYKIIDKL